MKKIAAWFVVLVTRALTRGFYYLFFLNCIHGVVVIDKQTDNTICCGEQMKFVDNWWVCTKCWKHWKEGEIINDG